MGGTSSSQALEPSSNWSKGEGMAGDKRSLALESSEAGSIDESAEEEGGTCSGEGHRRVDGLVGAVRRRMAQSARRTALSQP